MSGRVLFAVPADDVRWCAMLAEALSVCCISPSAARRDEARALLNMPPPVMLPNAWDDLAQAGRGWLILADAEVQRGREAPAFKGGRMIEAALNDKPFPVPAWAERYR